MTLRTWKMFVSGTAGAGFAAVAYGIVVDMARRLLTSLFGAHDDSLPILELLFVLPIMCILVLGAAPAIIAGAVYAVRLCCRFSPP